jgi:hypothetical protein
VVVLKIFSVGGAADKCFSLSMDEVELDNKSGDANSLFKMLMAETFALTVDKSP